jgi:hypothetical protein
MRSIKINDNKQTSSGTRDFRHRLPKYMCAIASCAFFGKWVVKKVNVRKRVVAVVIILNYCCIANNCYS